jgi:hypothetical protein
MATKEEAETAKLQAEAEKLRLDNEERQTQLAQQRRDAEARAAVAKAEKEAISASLSAYTDVIPDLSKVDRGETKVTGDAGLFASALALRALEGAATEVAKDIKRKVGNNYRLLLTADPDLATTDAAYLETIAGLDELASAADKLLQPPAEGNVHFFVASAAVLGVGAALASAIPSVLSLMAARRSLSSREVPADDVLALMQVSAALAEADPGGFVWIDDFRVLRTGKVTEAVASVREKRQQLVERKLELKDREDGSDSVLAATVDALIASIDNYMVALFKVADGGKRSLYTMALLREQLHTKSVSHVVLVKGSSGDANQLINDRPLWWEDKFSTVASMGVSYVLVSVEDGRVTGGGTRSASRSISGSIGSTFSIDNVRTPEFE